MARWFTSMISYGFAAISATLAAQPRGDRAALGERLSEKRVASLDRQPRVQRHVARVVRAQEIAVRGNTGSP